jgi:hypothetical protein
MLDVITGVFYTLKLGRYVVWDVLRWVHFVCFKISREDLSSELISLFSSVADIFFFSLNVYLVFCLIVLK